MIANVGLNIVGEDTLIHTFPLYTDKTDFNRAKSWLNFHKDFTLSDTTMSIRMKSVHQIHTNYTGSTTCSYMYSSTTTFSWGLAVWVIENNDSFTLSRKVEVIGYQPEPQKVKSQLDTVSVVLPKGLYAGTSRCYLFGFGIGRFDSGYTTCVGPDFKFYKDDGTYDLLTYRGYYTIDTPGGTATVYEPGSTNTSGGNTYYYDMNDVDRNTTDIYTSSGDTAQQTSPLKNDDGYRVFQATATRKDVPIGYREYENLYLPLVDKPGMIAVRAFDGTSELVPTPEITLYMNESFIVTNCSGTMDYTGTIDCPKYGSDCVGESLSDDIFGEGRYCDVGQDIEIRRCIGESMCQGETCSTITSTTIVKCTSAACTNLTETDANRVPGCTVQKSYDDGDTSTLPDKNDIPAIDSWTDPNACNTQTDQFGNYCDVDGPNSVTCLGRTDMDGNRLPDENTIDNWELTETPCTILACQGETQKTIKDKSTGKNYCMSQVSYIIGENDELLGIEVADYAEVNEDGIMVDTLPAEGIYVRVDCSGETVGINETTLPDGSVRRTYAEDKGGGVTEIVTVIEYPDGSWSETSRMVDDDGTVVGIMTRDRNGGIAYCMGDSCSTDSTLSDLYWNPTVEKACTALQEITTESQLTDQTDPSGTPTPVKPIAVCNSKTTQVTIGGQPTYITWQNGVPVDPNCGKVIETQSSDCGGETETVIKTDDGDITINKPEDQDSYTITNPDGTVTTVYTRPDGITVTVEPDGTTTAEWGDDLGNDVPATCWGSKSTGDVCGGINNPSSGYCEVGAGHQ